jgi:hypothetical protein
MPYELRETVPDPERYVELRAAGDMNPKSLEAARRGLPNTFYGVTVVETDTGETVGMARIIGDEGIVYRRSRPSAPGSFENRRFS